MCLWGAPIAKTSVKVIVCIGYPSLMPEQFLLRVRGTNWAVAKNDAEIIQMGECFIARSRQYQEICKQHNIKFIDTSDEILTAVARLCS